MEKIINTRVYDYVIRAGMVWFLYENVIRAYVLEKVKTFELNTFNEQLPSWGLIITLEY